MRRRRGGVPDRVLAAGPGRLTQALGVTRSLDQLPMRGAPVEVFRGEPLAPPVATPRIGITKAVDWPLRFVEGGTRWASRKRDPLCMRGHGVGAATVECARSHDRRATPSDQSASGRPATCRG